VALPIISRLFAPDAVGIWAIFQSLLFIPSTFSTFRYELAVVIEPRDDDADAVVALVLLLCTSLGALAILVASGAALAGLFPIANTLSITSGFCLGASFTGVGLFYLGLSIANRKSDFKAMFRSRLLSAVTGVAVPIAAAPWSKSADMLVLGTLLGFFAGALPAAGHILRSTMRFLSNGHGWAHIRQVATANRSFARFTAPYTLVTQLFGFCVTSLFAVAHGPFVVGQFALMFRILNAPASIAVNSVGQYVVRPLVGLSHNRSAATAPILATAIALLSITLPLATIATVFGEELFVLVFGLPWRLAGEFVALAAIPMCLHLSISWIDRLFDAWREQRFGFVVGSIGCAVWLSLLVAVQFIWAAPSVTVAGWSVGLALNATIWLVAVLKLTGLPGDQRPPVLKVLMIGTLPLLLVAHLVSGESLDLKVAALSSTTVGVYYCLWVIVKQHRADFLAWTKRA
jgi:O-antigen/teichoic acid export membrane protein